MWRVPITFSGTYSEGGEDISEPLGQWGVGVQAAFLDGAPPHLMPVVDLATEKIKLFGLAPAIVREEPHLIPATPFVITLDYPAAAILNVASATAHYPMIEASDTLASGEVQLATALAEGVRSTLKFNTAQAAQTVYVTYITQAWREVWENRHAAADFTTATHVASLGVVACLIESCMSKATGGTVVASTQKYVRGGDAAAAAAECEVDLTDSGATPANTTTLTFYATDAVLTGKVTYIELPASGFLFNRFLEDFDNTMAAGVSAANCPAFPVLFHTLAGQLPDYTAANERDPHISQMTMADALGTGGEFKVNYYSRPGTGITGQIGTNDATSDAVSLTYIYGVPDEIPGIVPLELRAGTSLTGLTARLLVIGRRS
jgi:hypothetical protein